VAFWKWSVLIPIIGASDVTPWWRGHLQQNFRPGHSIDEGCCSGPHSNQIPTAVWGLRSEIRMPKRQPSLGRKPVLEARDATICVKRSRILCTKIPELVHPNHPSLSVCSYIFPTKPMLDSDGGPRMDLHNFQKWTLNKNRICMCHQITPKNPRALQSRSLAEVALKSTSPRNHRNVEVPRPRDS